MLRTLVTIAGVLAMLMGLLWVGQGLGIVHWPASSFMLDQRIWSLWGALLAAAGGVVIFLARRR